MIKFTMGSSDTKKMHRRKPKRTTKSFNSSGPLGHQGSVGGSSTIASLPSMSLANSPSTSARQSVQTVSPVSAMMSSQPYSQISGNDVQFIQKLMDSRDCAHPSRDRCLLCQAPRVGDSSASPSVVDQQDDTIQSGVGVAITSSQVWVCAECRQTVEEEEEKRAAQGLLEQDLMLGPPTSPANISSASDTDGASGDAAVSCNCDSCTERRRIEEEQERETAELQKTWSDLHQMLLLMFRKMADKSACTNGLKSSSTPVNDNTTANSDKSRELLERLCTFDPHDLYHRIESTCREYMVERKAHLLEQFPALSGSQQITIHPETAGQLVVALLQENESLTVICQKMSIIAGQLEQHHLSRFQLSIELLFRHIFNSVIYADVKKHVPNLIQHFRSASSASESESHLDESSAQLLCRYLAFDTEMMQVAVRWRESYQLIEQYNDEQDAAKAKQKMLMEDWEFFRAQRRLLEQHLLKQQISCHGVDEMSSDAAMMWQLQNNTKGDLVYPRHTYTQQNHCICDECNILRMVASGIVNPEITDQLAHSPGGDKVSAYVRSLTRYSCYNGAPHLPSYGAGDGNNPEQSFLPAFVFGSSEIPEEFDEEGEDEDDAVGPPAWKEQRLVEGQDGSSCSTTSKNSKEVSKENQVTADGSENDDDANCSGNESDSEEDAKYEGAWLANQQQPVQQTQQHCQCPYCYQQAPSGLIEPPSFFMQPPMQPSGFRTYPQQLQSSGGIMQPVVGYPVRQPLLTPQLYQLHCPVPAQNQRHPGDGMVSHGELVPSVFATQIASSTAGGQQEMPAAGTGFFSGWHEVYNTKCPTFSTTISSVSFSNIGPQLPAVQVATIPAGITAGTPGVMTTAWKVPSFCTQSTTTSSTAFSMPSLSPLPPCSTSHNVSYPLQHPGSAGQLSMDAQAQFPNTSSPGCPSAAKKTGGTRKMASGNCGDGADQQLAPCSHSEHALVNMPASTSSPVNGAAQKSLSSSPVASVSSTNSSGSPSCKVSKNASVNSAPSCNGGGAFSECSSTNSRNGACNNDYDDEDDEGDDEGSISEGSSSASNQKDGKFCECWHCEFFGHSGPQTVPTSKNYPEMRDRLRLRLKKKQDTQPSSLQNEQKLSVTSDTESQPVVCTNTTKCERQYMNVDELLRYINGDTNATTTTKPKTSQKAAKRARQKQRKAAEKMKGGKTNDSQTSQQEDVCVEKNNKHASSPISISSHVIQSSSGTSMSSSVSSVDQPAQKKVTSPQDLSTNSRKMESTNCRASKTNGGNHQMRGTKSLSNGIAPQTDMSIDSDQKENFGAKQQSCVMLNGTCALKVNSQCSELNKPSNGRKNDLHAKTVISCDTRQTDDKLKGNVLSSAACGILSDVSSAGNQSAGKMTKNRRQPKVDTEALNGQSQPDVQNRPSAKNPLNSPVSAPKCQKPTSDIVHQKSAAIVEVSNGHSVSNHASLSKDLSRSTGCNYKSSTALSKTADSVPSSARQVVTAIENKNGSPIKNGLPNPTKQPVGLVQQPSNGNHVMNGVSLPVSRQSVPNGRAVNGIAAATPMQTAASLPENGSIAINIGPLADSGNDMMAGPRGKKSRRKGKGKGELTSVDEIFLPKQNVEQGRLDDFEREIEEFKRFCFNSTLADNREKLQVNMNLKDIFAKKKNLGSSYA